MRKSLLKGAWIFSLITTITLGLFIIPLAWLIPLNVMIYKAYKEEREVSGVFAFVYAVFGCDPIGSTLLVVSQGRDQRRLYIFAVAVYNTIVAGSLIIPLAWMIPMTIKLHKHVSEGSEMSVAFRICYYLFMHQFGGLILLLEPEQK